MICKVADILLLLIFPRILGSANLTTVSVKGVAAALAKHTPAGDPKGVKAFFKMDENGFLILEKVVSVAPQHFKVSV